MFGLIIPLGIPAYLLLQVVLPINMTGGWRKAAYVPLVFSVPITVWCLMAFVAQSSLWPLTFILFAPLGTLYLVILLVLRLARNFIHA